MYRNISGKDVVYTKNKYKNFYVKLTAYFISLSKQDRKQNE